MDTNVGALSTVSCVIKANFPKLESSACGTIIDPSRGLILSHGSILSEYLSEHKSLMTKVNDGKLLQPNDFLESNFSVLISNHLVSPDLLTIGDKQNTLLTIGTSSSLNGDETDSQRNDKLEDSTSQFTNIPCQLIGAFQNKDFHKTLSELMPRSGWAFNDTDNQVKVDDKNHLPQDVKQECNQNEMNGATYQLLSYFLLFKFNYLEFGIPKNVIKSKSKKLFQNIVPLRSRRDALLVGQSAEIIATPFGSLCPSVFFNGYSRGVISNVSGVDDCWIITDARCIPGCEGGPLYTKQKSTDTESSLIGIITSPLCWKNNEWVGFSVACSIDSILKSMAQYREIVPQKNQGYWMPTQKQKNGNHSIKGILPAQEVTILVQCGNTWGTGVIVDRDKGVILTCSHVIKGANSNSVTVRSSKSTTSFKGEVVYRQDPVTAPYDMAVLKCVQATRHLPKGWSMGVAQACVGEDVLLSGHAVFNTDRHLKPSVCQGVVSKVLRRNSEPVMIQTTCAIHAGSSGGPLLTPDSRLVGIAVCNIRDAASNTSFPHVNLCIPIATVWPVISSYLTNGDQQGLSRLQNQDAELSQLWALGVQTSHETRNLPFNSKL